MNKEAVRVVFEELLSAYEFMCRDFINRTGEGEKDLEEDLAQDLDYYRSKFEAAMEEEK
jgi:hypothetical protein